MDKIIKNIEMVGENTIKMLERMSSMKINK